MTRRIVGSTCAAALLAATVTAAQAPTQAPTQGNPQAPPSERTTTPTARTQSDQQVTLTGCVTREGSSDFVLADATSSTSGNLSGGVAGSTSTAPVGTTGASAGAATGTTGITPTRFRLSGERDLAGFVGQRVEIVGRMDQATNPRSAASGTTPGLSAPNDTPRSGVDSIENSSDRPGAGRTTAGTTGTSSADPTARGITGSTAPIQHVTVTSVRTVDGTCP